MIVRQYATKGDPCLSVKLPATLIVALKQEAKENKRPYQDELAKRLHATFKKNTKYRTRVSMIISQLKENEDLAPYRQIISRDIKNLLMEAATIDNHSLSEEVCFRLKISFIEKQAMGTSQIYTKIIRHKLTQKTLAAQRAAMIQGQRYILELQQLEINLRNESWIPQELMFTAFEQIDLKQETIRIRENIKVERQAILEEDRKYGFL